MTDPLSEAIQWARAERLRLTLSNGIEIPEAKHLRELIKAAKDGERWQFWRDEMDMSDARRMLAAGTDNFDKIIDKAMSNHDQRPAS